MKIIRTSLSYYNGHEFIGEQLESIMNQRMIGEFETQIYIYDDGSSKDSIKRLKKIVKGNKKIVLKIDGENKGVFYRYINSFVDASLDGVDFLFWADQDDFFFDNKYIKHIKLHSLSNKSLVVTGDNKWNYEIDKVVPQTWKHASGHNFSFNMKSKFISNLNFDNLSRLLLTDINNKGTLKYHDAFLKFVFAVNDEEMLDCKVITANHRVHGGSITNSENLKGRPWRVWADEYNYYFKFLKIWYPEVVGKKLTIREYNNVYAFHDDYELSGRVKAFLDNFVMRLRLKWFRNTAPKGWFLYCILKFKILNKKQK